MPALLSLLSLPGLYAQSGSGYDTTGYSSQLKLNRRLVHGTSVGLMSATFVGLNQAWYSQYQRGSFHFFNDSQEWLQADKAGHAFTGYFITGMMYPAYRFAGYSQEKSAWMAMGFSWVSMAGIEVLDGFSEKWGASWTDLVANTAGIGLAGFQQLAWQEQRLWLKFSSGATNYPNDRAVQARVDNLFGETWAEKMLKDYNRSTYWVSANVYSFMPEESKFPKWLNVSAGYGVEGLLGGFNNAWQLNDIAYNYSQIDRYRQYYLAPDVDFTRLPIKGKAWTIIAPALNIFKFPAPAVEFSKHGTRWHWFKF
jgi:hypothetical protein